MILSEIFHLSSWKKDYRSTVHSFDSVTMD